MEPSTSAENALRSHLQHLASLDWELLQLSQRELPDADAYVYFPGSALIALRDPASGMQAAMVGQRGSTGVYLRQNLKATVLVNGTAWRIRRSALLRAACAIEAARDLLQADHDELIEQMLCALRRTARNEIKQRAAAWLLEATHHSGLDVLRITHDEIAGLLGVRRSGVTLALHEIESAGGARSTRGRIVIRDIDKLRRTSGPAAREGRRPVLHLPEEAVPRSMASS
jgi:hypothetical protein